MKSKEIFLISLSIFLTICAWLLADIYNISRKTSNQLKENYYNNVLIESIKFDQEVLKELRNKK